MVCSNCHNKIHYGRDSKDLIESLYKKRIDFLKEVGLYVSLEDLLSYYK